MDEMETKSKELAKSAAAAFEEPRRVVEQLPNDQNAYDTLKSRYKYLLEKNTNIRERCKQLAKARVTLFKHLYKNRADTVCSVKIYAESTTHVLN